MPFKMVDKNGLSYYYGQENPRDQLRIIIGSIKGWLSNLEDGATKPERFIEKVKLDIEAAKRMLEILPPGEWPKE